MKIPGFDADFSLGPTIGRYRGAVSGGFGAGSVLPMQELRSSSALTGNLNLVFGRTIKCCLPGRHPACQTYTVPFAFLWDCVCVLGAPVCTPRVFENA